MPNAMRQPRRPERLFKIDSTIQEALEYPAEWRTALENSPRMYPTDSQDPIEKFKEFVRLIRDTGGHPSNYILLDFQQWLKNGRQPTNSLKRDPVAKKIEKVVDASSDAMKQRLERLQRAQTARAKAVLEEPQAPKSREDLPKVGDTLDLGENDGDPVYMPGGERGEVLEQVDQDDLLSGL